MTSGGVVAVDGYLDHNATAPLLPEVLNAMTEALGQFGNPSSIHRRGAEARYIIEKARRQIARCLDGANPDSIVFTSGATEANNLALRGFVAAHQGRRVRIISPATEHAAVYETIAALQHLPDVEITRLPVDGFGRLGRPFGAHLPADGLPSLLSVMLANNETGTLEDVPALAGEWHANDRRWLHTDAVQALGRVPLSIDSLDADLVTVTSHKVGGPKGVGLLWIRPGTPIQALQTGGHQEFGWRAGTEPSFLIAGLAVAIRLATERQREAATHMAGLRDELWRRLEATLIGIQRNSPPDGVLPNTLNVSIPGCPSQRLVHELDRRGFAVSAGSACTSAGKEAPSRVLMAMGFDESRASSSLRISLGANTTNGEVERFIAAILEAIPCAIESSKA